jgi:hypothetical protein
MPAPQVWAQTMPTRKAQPLNSKSPRKTQTKYGEDDIEKMINYNYDCVNNFAPPPSNGPDQYFSNTLPIKTAQRAKNSTKATGKPQKGLNKSRKKPKRSATPNKGSQAFQSDNEKGVGPARSNRMRELQPGQRVSDVA